MTHIIDRLNAVAEGTVHAVAANNGRPIYVPDRLDPRTLVGVLSQLGLVIPTAVSAGVAADNLRASGHKFSIKETDAVMASANLSISDRIKLKAAMSQNNLIER
jgi:hypothetical protein